MIIKIKARDTADPAKMIKSRPVFFLSCFVSSELATDSRVVVSDLKKKNAEEKFIITLTRIETRLLEKRFQIIFKLECLINRLF